MQQDVDGVFMLFTKEASQLVRRLHDSILTCLVRGPERLHASPEVACSFTSDTQCNKQTFLRDGVCSTRHSRCGTSADLRESWPVEDQAYHVARLSWRRAVALRGEKGPMASKARTHHMQLTRKVWPWLSEKFAQKKKEQEGNRRVAVSRQARPRASNGQARTWRCHSRALRV